MSGKILGIEHPNDLLIDSTGLLLLDLYLAELSIELKDYLLTPKDDLYIKNSSQSIVRSDTPRYILDVTKSGSPTLTPLIDYKQLLEKPVAIYDHGGNMLLSGDVLFRHRHKLTTQPDFPIYTTTIVESYLLKRMSDICKYGRFSGIKSIEDFIIPGSLDVVMTIIEDVCSVAMAEIYNFVGSDKYHIYFKRRQGTTLLIEKTVDWRIYDWHCNQKD